MEDRKQQHFSAAVFHRLISQLALGRSSALPSLDCIFSVDLFDWKMHLHGLKFVPKGSACRPHLKSRYKCQVANKVLPITLYATIKTRPTEQIVKYFTVSSNASAGAFMILQIYFEKITNKIVSKIEIAVNKMTAEPIISPAYFRFPLPIFCVSSTVVPIDKHEIAVVMLCIN